MAVLREHGPAARAQRSVRPAGTPATRGIGETRARQGGPPPPGQPAAPPRAGPDFFAVDAATLARRLLGQVLVRALPQGERLAGRIVETEAYLGAPDKASHAFRGRRTPRTEPMFARGGTSYVYFTYGMHHCMNISASEAGVPHAVLIRALEPLEGVATMRLLRMRSAGGGSTPRDADLCRGPGRLCAALAIDRTLSGVDMTSSDRLFVELARTRALPASRLAVTRRVGVEGAGAWGRRRLRWLVREHPCVSAPHPRKVRSRPRRRTDG
jgi:DNA-3-methyladenine glycosylase